MSADNIDTRRKNNMTNIISCSNLTHYYGKKLIYKDLCFEVAEGSILGLLGKNGTGKTTTINILNGFIKPKSGVCKLLGEDIRTMRPETRREIGMLLEGHVQYPFMTIAQLEKFYSSFYPKWNRGIYYELLEQLKVAPTQKISSMSCGQRSQVVLGLIMAQNPKLLILDDFSLGLDPGYRRLFVDYLRDYAKRDNKTVFLTSHIIQDMERLIDDCIILDYGGIRLHSPVNDIMKQYRHCSFTLLNDADLSKCGELLYPLVKEGKVECGVMNDEETIRKSMDKAGINYEGLKLESATSLEDAFIGITGKY